MLSSKNLHKLCHHQSPHPRIPAAASQPRGPDQYLRVTHYKQHQPVCRRLLSTMGTSCKPWKRRSLQPTSSAAASLQLSTMQALQAVMPQPTLAYSICSRNTNTQCTPDTEHSIAAVDSGPCLPLSNSALHQLCGMMLHA